LIFTSKDQACAYLEEYYKCGDPIKDFCDVIKLNASLFTKALVNNLKIFHQRIWFKLS